ncbi:MAG: stage 0 sporulation protein J, partial [Clostridia bacterium]|nr:stage 0 sporulation protein J [Clostridia bacterium]
RLMKLPEKELKMLEQGTLSAGHARALLSIEDEEKLHEAAKIVIEKKLSVRETEKLVKKFSAKGSAAAKKPVTRNSFYDEVELTLKESLGRRIRVLTPGGKPSGTIEISFFDKDDLERIAKVLGGLE